MFSKQRAGWLVFLAVLMIVTSQIAVSSPWVSSSVSAAPFCDPITPFNPAKFSNPTRIDNRWFPLTPGTQSVLEGRATRGGGALPHRVVFTVTDLTKVINGVRTVVMYDLDYSEDQIVEAELAFFAQDDFGNVWLLGEYPEEYEDGAFAGAPSTWIAGQEQAEAGTLVPGSPQVGVSFLQGWSLSIKFLDCGKVSKVGQSECIPLRCFQDVLVIEEKSPLRPETGFQLKYYAPGVGNFLADFVSDIDAEVLELVSTVRLNPGALAQAREEALKLDARAYGTKGHLYRNTSAAQQTIAQTVAPSEARADATMAVPVIPSSAAAPIAAALPVLTGPVTFEVKATGVSTIPAVSGPGSGFARFTLDGVGRKLSYAITVFGFSPNLVAGAHIHRGVNGVNGPIVMTISDTGFTQISGELTLNETDIVDLRLGNLYLNLTSVENPGGFARGQLILPVSMVTPPRVGDAGLLDDGLSPPFLMVGLSLFAIAAFGAMAIFAKSAIMRRVSR